MTMKKDNQGKIDCVSDLIPSQIDTTSIHQTQKPSQYLTIKHPFQPLVEHPQPIQHTTPPPSLLPPLIIT